MLIGFTSGGAATGVRCCGAAERLAVRKSSAAVVFFMADLYTLP
jgi:hypothetical protein